MFTHHEHQSLGQDKSASPTVTRERCIPIKRRWLQKFDPSKGNRSSQPDCSSRSSSSGVFSETELPGNHFYEVEQSEALDFTRPRKSTSGHRLANQVSSKKSQVSLATNSNRSLYKRGFDTQSQSPLSDRSLKRFRHSSPSLQANQLTGTSYRLPSAVQARNSFGILANDQLNPRKYKEQDNLQTDFKFGSADRQAQARQQLQFQKPILEQCLRGCHLGSLPGRPTVRNVLRHQDHTKLSIGERTELDKMHYEEISAKYFNANFEKQPASELLHSASSVRRKAGTSSMMFDQDTHWNRLDSQGSSVSSSADTFIRSYGTTSGTTTSIQHQPYASQSETYHNSEMPQDVVMLENNMSTITVNELFNLVGVTQEFMSQDQTPSHSTDDQSDHLHQMGKGSRSIASKVDSRHENLKQPKAELMVDGLPSCQRSNGQFHHQPGAEISEEVSEHLHVVEELVSQNQTKVVKTEADSCTLPTNGKSLTPTAVIKRELGSRTKKPLDGKCPICTDVISGYHYGTHSCESCKGFFKRTIQNKRNERLACALIGNCVINLQNRKHCASCRFKKCLESGMKQEAVREDRQRGGRSMYEGSSEQQRRQHLQLQQEQKEALGQVKKRKPRKRASSTTTQPPDENGADQNLETTTRLPPQQTLRSSNPSTSCPVPTTSMITLSTSSRSSDSSDEGHQYLKTLESLEATFFNPFGLPRISVDRTNSEKSLLTGAYYLMDYFCKKMPLWIEMMPFLQDLEVFDRSVLLKANWLQVLVLTVCFRCHNNEGHLILPDRSTCDMMSMVTSVGILDIARRMKQLAQKFQALKTTQDEYFYLKLLILLNPDVKNLSQPSRIRRFQETVQEHLFDHGMAKEGIASGMKIGELLLKLSELQRLSHLIKEHLVFTQVAGRLGPRSYCNLENMLDD